MKLAGAVAIVTGGGSGIGRALCERFAHDGAQVAVVDRDGEAARAVADGLGSSFGAGADVTDEAAVTRLVAQVEQRLGPIDIYCSNAGVSRGQGLGDDDDWARSWQVHVLAHVYAARAVLPTMARRRRGHFSVTASAAGLLTNMDSAPYSVTKHGAVALAEWLAISYAGSGVGFSCLCPQGVRTPMIAGAGAHSATLAAGELVEPAAVADAMVVAMMDGRFLVLPHPEVAGYDQRRAADRDRWIAGMARIRDRLRG
ncbi:MAG: SDR family oxidoreductase [Actinomycetota bacterium]|nr:SDR family oxidoreductase [Actinomycetota bacterium]